MLAAPIPLDDDARLEALFLYQILDTAPEQVFDDLTSLASHILDVPIALMSLIDRDRQWFKSCHGLAAQETPRDVSFCGHAVAAKERLWVPNTLHDERFADNPYVVGEPHVMFYVGVPLITHDGYALGTLCAIDQKPRDVTVKQVELLEALARQTTNQLDLRFELLRRDEVMQARQDLEKHKDTFISIVNHELRTPLTSIRGSLGLLQGGVAGELPAAARELVDVATRNCTRLVRLISDMLDLDKLQRGIIQIEKLAVNPVELVRESIEQNQGYASEERVSLELRVIGHDQIPNIDADHDRMLQVLDNLISNAVKYSPEHGEVVVEVEAKAATERHRGSVRLAVYDQGPGVPEEFRERLFEKFAQSEVRPNSDKPGTGLGLALAKWIVDLHGGVIEYQPNPSGGSCFSVVIHGADRVSS